MTIKELFDTDAPRGPQQDNWLKMVAAIPGAKRAFQDPVTPEDEAIAAEAQSLLTGTPKPSPAQAKIIARMQAGGRLVFNTKTGRYTMTEGGKEKDIDQRPILVMLRDGLLFQDMSGFCRLEP